LKLGARVLRNGPGGVLNQLKSIEAIKPSVLIAVPSFILKLIEYSQLNGIDLKSYSVKSIVCIGEPIHNSDFSLNNLAQSIVENWDVNLLSTYASTEMATAFYQCKNQKGCHNNNELLHTEIVDEHGVHVKNGEMGEIVITTLGVQGMPFVRYKTGDVATYWSDDCGCGEDSLRIGPIEGRKDQMIKFRGTTIYPQSIYNALNSITHINNFFIEIFQDQITATEVRISLINEDVQESDKKDIASTLNSLLRVTPSIELKPREEIEGMIAKHSNRKKTRIIFIQNPES
jgi:phenylacetate-CoA ligase